MEEFEKVLVIDDSQFLLRYAGDYQVEVLSAAFSEGSLLYVKDTWEDGIPQSLSLLDCRILEGACREMIDWNLRRPGFLFHESAGGM
jgi:hypothetical protein